MDELNQILTSFGALHPQDLYSNLPILHLAFWDTILDKLFPAKDNIIFKCILYLKKLFLILCHIRFKLTSFCNLCYIKYTVLYPT